MEDGTKSASEATMAPGMPATFQPTRVASSTPGPGAARAMANRSTKSCSLIQWRDETAFWMPASMLGPPPIDSSDSGMNTTSNPMSGLSRTASLLAEPGKRDACRRHADHHRHHRPAQHADGEEQQQQDGYRPDAALDPAAGADADHDGEADRRRGDAVDEAVQPQDPGDPVVEHAERHHDDHRRQQHAEQRHDRADAAAQPLADIEREVSDIGTGHDLAERQAAEKIRLVHPAAAHDDLAMHPARERAAEAHQPDLGEDAEDGEERNARRRDGLSARRRRHNGQR